MKPVFSLDNKDNTTCQKPDLRSKRENINPVATYYSNVSIRGKG